MQKWLASIAVDDGAESLFGHFIVEFLFFANDDGGDSEQSR